MNKSHEIENTKQNFLTIIEKVALDPTVNVDKMEKILDMQERILNKQSEIEFNQAMVKAIAEIPSFEKNKKGHKWKYATFESINRIVKPILSKHELFVTFITDFQKDDFVLVIAKITHKSGHSQDTSMRFPFDISGSKNVIQATGSAISYGKRYTMNALLNISTHDEDADGFVAEKTIDANAVARINIGLDKSGVSLQDLCKYMNVDRLSDITINNYNVAIVYLKAIIESKDNDK